MLLDSGQVYRLCFPMDTGTKEVLFRKYVKEYKKDILLTLLDFQGYVECMGHESKAKYRRRIKWTISPAKKKKLENKLQIIDTRIDELSNILCKMQDCPDSTLTHKELKYVLDIIHAMDSNKKRQRILLIVSGISLIISAIVLFSWL